VANVEKVIYLSLGSNVADRLANLRSAIAALPQAGVRVTCVSSIYETQPVDFLDQAWFLNCVVAGETKSPPLELLTSLHAIETALGSKKEFAKGPRLLDIDILLYGDDTIAMPELKIPHPRLTQRRFVLVPLNEVAPRLRHSQWSGTVSQLLAATLDQSEVNRLPAS